MTGASDAGDASGTGGASGARAWDSTAHGPVLDRSGPSGAGQPPGSARAVPLLDLITRQSMDEDYQHVAERRRREGTADAPATRGGSRLTIAAVLVFGLLVAVAAVQTSRNASIDSASKDQLIGRINTRRAAVAALQKQIADERATTTRMEGEYGDLGHRLDRVDATRTALGRVTGWEVVQGDGVRVRIDDAPNGGSDGQVRDSDLAGLVNGLLQAGARAVSINGQRITAVSALRNAGTVVGLNGVSLSPPYTVLAVGDRNTLQARFAQSTSGQRLRAVVRQYGMPFSMHNETGLTVPAAPSSMLVLRYARSADGPKNDKEMP